MIANGVMIKDKQAEFPVIFPCKLKQISSPLCTYATSSRNVRKENAAAVKGALWATSADYWELLLQRIFTEETGERGICYPVISFLSFLRRNYSYSLFKVSKTAELVFLTHDGLLKPIPNFFPDVTL